MTTKIRPAVPAVLCSLALLTGCGGDPGQPPAATPSAGTSADGAAATPRAASTAPPLPKDAFRLEWGTHEVPGSFVAGKPTPATIRVRNVSSVSWPDVKTADPQGKGYFAVRLAWRFTPEGGKARREDFVGRADLSAPVPPGETATIVASLRAPAAPGSYTLEFDLLQEMVDLFGMQGSKTLRLPVTVTK